MLVTTESAPHLVVAWALPILPIPRCVVIRRADLIGPAFSTFLARSRLVRETIGIPYLWRSRRRCHGTALRPGFAPVRAVRNCGVAFGSSTGTRSLIPCDHSGGDFLLRTAVTTSRTARVTRSG